MGDWDDDDWEAEVDLGALDSKLGGGAKAAWDDEEDEVEVQVAEVAKPSSATLAAKAKEVAIKEQTLQNQVKNALQEDEDDDSRKLRERRQVEEADHALTEELMGAAPKKKATLGGPTGLAGISLNTKAEHTTFGVTISKKLADSTPLTVVAFFKSLCERLPASMTTESLDQILAVLNEKRAIKKEKEGEVAKVKVGKSKKEVKKEKKRHADVFGGDDQLDDYYETYGSIEDDFM